MVARIAALASFAGLALAHADSHADAHKRGLYAYEPLYDVKYDYDQLPQQINPYNVGRGPQSGYNICNSSTAGQNSMCQTLIFNDIDDFCIWSSATPNELIGNIEGEVVAWCTPKNAHGSRTIPAGTITGLQMVTTSAYIQITGFIDQTKLNLAKDDSGGELDPHGADQLGNPLGGLVYSNSLNGAQGGNDLRQVYNWNEFIGSNTFCIKLCQNSITSPNYCQNKFDLIGCDYNMPSNAQDGEFTKCESDLQMEAGVYVGSNGHTSVWSQPADIGDNYKMPYTPTVPASSKCTTYASTDLFAGALFTNAPASAATTSASTVTTTTSASTATATTTSVSGTASTGTSSATIASATTSSQSTTSASSSQSIASDVAGASSSTIASAPSATSKSAFSGASTQGGSAALTLAMSALVMVAGVAFVM